MKFPSSKKISNLKLSRKSCCIYHQPPSRYTFITRFHNSSFRSYFNTLYRSWNFAVRKIIQSIYHYRTTNTPSRHTFLILKFHDSLLDPRILSKFQNHLLYKNIVESFFISQISQTFPPKSAIIPSSPPTTRSVIFAPIFAPHIHHPLSICLRIIFINRT